MTRNSLKLALATTALVATGAQAQDVTLTIESWRNDDLALWQEKIIPAFEAQASRHQDGSSPHRPRRNTTPP